MDTLAVPVFFCILGKTTLLTYLVSTLGSSSKKLAIIQNEINELNGVEQELNLQIQNNNKDEKEEEKINIVELSNGCVCCSVK